MIIKQNYLYQNVVTLEFALGGVDVLLTGNPVDINLQFIFRNNGKIESKMVSVLEDEWDNTPKEPLT